MPASSTTKDEKEIRRILHDAFGWALTKDRALFESIFAKDDDFFSFFPDSKSTVRGWSQFEKFLDGWMDPRNVSIGFEIRDLRIVVSKRGDTAWFSAIVDDEGEFDGVPWGSKDMRLEQGFFELWNPSFKGTRMEAVFTQEGIEALKRLDHPEQFIDAMNLSKIKLYMVDKCDFAISGCEHGGFLFLPQHDSKVDFNSCLCFENPAGITWLIDVFDSLRIRSTKIGIQELLG